MGLAPLNFMVDAQRIHRVVGRASEGVTRTQCETFIAAKRTEAREGRLSLPKGRKTYLGFEEAAEDYLPRLEESGGKNLAAKRRHFRMYLNPFFGRQKLEKLSTFLIDRYKKDRRDAGAADGTVNRELATLSHFLNKASEWNWLQDKPCKIRKLSEGPGRIIALTDEQAEAVFKRMM